MTDDSAVIGYYRHYFYGLNISSSDPFVAVVWQDMRSAGASFEIGFLSFSFCRVLHGPSRPLKKASYLHPYLHFPDRFLCVLKPSIGWVGAVGVLLGKNDLTGSATAIVMAANNGTLAFDF